MEATYTIPSTTPVQIFPAGLQTSVSVVNTGANMVYLSSIANAYQGFPLAGGNAVPWEAKHPLYAYAANGAPTTLFVTDSALAAQTTNVSATLTGPIAVSAIDTPVNIAGVVDVSGSNVGVTGAVTVTNPITGAVTVTNPITGAVTVTNPTGVPLDVSGSSVGVTGAVTVTNPIDVNGPIDVSGSNVGVTGDVTVTTPVGGSVTANIPGTVDVSGSNVSVTGAVTVTNPITGDVNIINSITGAVTVSNAIDINGVVDVSGSNVGVTGAVTVASIGAPVNVQGGGETLLMETLAVNIAVGPGISYVKSVQIPAPASALTYYGLRIRLSAQVAGPYVVSVSDGTGNNLATTTLYYAGLPLPANVSSIAPYCHEFTIPMTAQYPLTINVSQPWAAGGLGQVYVLVQGISVAPIGPVTNFAFMWNNGPTNGYVNPFTTNGDNIVYYPPSFQPYTIRIIAPNAAVTMEELQPDSYAFVTSNPYPALPTNYLGTGTLRANEVVEMSVVGSGRAVRVVVGTTDTRARLNIIAPR